jgi:hypothetical protein
MSASTTIKTRFLSSSGWAVTLQMRLRVSITTTGNYTLHNRNRHCRKSGSGYSYEYNLTDHLATPVSFNKNATTGLAKALQRDHYYAFGKPNWF